MPDFNPSELAASGCAGALIVCTFLVCARSRPGQLELASHAINNQTLSAAGCFLVAGGYDRIRKSFGLNLAAEPKAQDSAIGRINQHRKRERPLGRIAT